MVPTRADDQPDRESDGEGRLQHALGDNKPQTESWHDDGEGDPEQHEARSTAKFYSPSGLTVQPQAQRLTGWVGKCTERTVIRPCPLLR
ncbi:MAG: hypothetical protein AMXMBFR64_55300 [Myxococcales bacterium]